MIGLIGLISWRLLRQPPAPPQPPPIAIPEQPISLAGAQFRGAESAPWTLLLYEDFSCAACRMFEREAMPTLLRDYVEAGRIRLAVQTLPLQARGPAADGEYASAACAAARGHFWAFRDAMFARESPSIENAASILARVSAQDALPCSPLGPDSAVAKIDAARRSGIQGTPYFLLGTVSGESLTAAAAHRGVGQGDAWMRSWLDEHMRASGGQ
jgi:protein-disulfide isomerase